MSTIHNGLDILKAKTNKSKDELRREWTLSVIVNLLNKFTRGERTYALTQLTDNFGSIVRNFEPLRSWINQIKNW